MKKKHVAILIVILSILLILTIASIVGNIIKNKNKTNIEITSTDITPKVSTAPTDSLTETASTSPDKHYAVQLMSVQKYNNLKEPKQSLEQAGYKVEVVEAQVKGKSFYRLRLTDLYTEGQANELGKEIKNKFPQFKGYWIENTMPEPEQPKPIVTKQTFPESSPTIAKETKLYELQLIASPDKAYIEKIKQKLEKAGYKTNISSVIVDKRYYRLRMDGTYSKKAAEKLGEDVKKEFNAVTNYWVIEQEITTPKIMKEVKPTPAPQETPKPKITQKTVTPVTAPAKPESKPETQTKSPKHYTIICQQDNVSIYTGPGNHYPQDDIGQLMKDIKLYVLEEKDGWIRFSLTPDTKGWSGWVLKKWVE